MKSLPILVALQLLCFIGASQSYIDVVKVYYQASPANKFKNTESKGKGE